MDNPPHLERDNKATKAVFFASIKIIVYLCNRKYQSISKE